MIHGKSIKNCEKIKAEKKRLVPARMGRLENFKAKPY
jgi:hypothetical protein